MVKRAPARKRPRKAKPSTKFSLLLGGSIMAKKQPGAVLPKLTEAEQDLIWHLEHGYRLETDSVGGDPVLRSFEG